ncbi:MAG: radical SAM protein [bacterium]
MRTVDNQDYRPYYCVWELTLGCNLRCAHCGSRAGRPRPNELTTGECLDLVQQLADLECRLITLSGGEPTLRPDWSIIARTAIGRGIVVNMVTNGTTMTPRLAGRIADSGMSNVGLSLDGTPEVHDSIRGQGTFHKLLRAVSLLHAAKVPFSLLTHLNRDTLAELEQIHQLAVDLGAFSWRVQLGKAMGNLADNHGLCIQPRDLLSAVPRLATLKKTSPLRVDIGDSIGYYGPHEKVLRKTGWGNMRPLWGGCQAGRRAIGIESDGGIKGCLSLQGGLVGCFGEDPFREDTIRSRSLEQIWFDDNAFAFNRQQPLESLTGSCRRCRHAQMCRGGAKCVSSAFTGSVSEDPYCYWRVSQAESRRSKVAGAVRQRAAAAVVSVGLGLGAAACLGGCLDRAVGDPDPNQDAAAYVQQDAAAYVQQDAAVDPDPDPDAEPPSVLDYGFFPEPVDAGPDAEPPAHMDYGVIPEPDDAGIEPEPDAEPPVQNDYGDIPPSP